MVRILQVFEPPDGGVAEHVGQLALGLRDRPFEVEVAGPPASQIYQRLEAAAVPVHRLPFRRDYKHPGSEARACLGVARLLRGGRYDLVHCHSSKAGAIGRVAAAIGAVPALYTPHCFGFVGEVGAARRLAVPVIERALGRLSARIVCVCDDEMRIALHRRIAPVQRLAVIPYGVASARGDGSPDAALVALGAGGALIGNVGVLRRQKRQDLFLEAAATVLARDRSARVVLVGNGPLEAPLRDLASTLGLDGNERFAFLPFEPPVERYLSALDVIVLCSDWEALPISLLEALAWGVPQVGTCVSGIPEIVSPETGILVGPGDAAALADAMLELLADPSRRAALSRGSQVRHGDRFTLDRMLEDTAALYQQTLDAGGGRVRWRIGRATARARRPGAELRRDQ